MEGKKTKNVFFPALCSGPVPRRPTVKFVPAPLMLKCFFGVFFDFTRGSKATYRPNLRASVQWQWHCERHLLLDWCKSPNWTSSVIHITKKLYTPTPKKNCWLGCTLSPTPVRYWKPPLMPLCKNYVHFWGRSWGVICRLRSTTFPHFSLSLGHKHKDRL